MSESDPSATSLNESGVMGRIFTTRLERTNVKLGGVLTQSVELLYQVFSYH